MQRGSFQWMKSINKTIILNKIRTSGPISRADIAKETSLTPPTVGSIVKELIEQGIVMESQQGESQGGRKPTMLVINREEFFVIGMDAGPKTVDCLVTNLAGERKCDFSLELEEELSNEAFLSVLIKGVEQMLATVNKPKEKIIGIGVAMHGVVDVQNGIGKYAPNLHLTDIPIKEVLEDHFDLTVKVENDARAMALGESWFGGWDDTKSMLAVNIGRGIGGGIVLDGTLLHGEHDIAGEIGHMTLDLYGRPCECGSNGCFQTLASGPSIEQKVQAALQNGEESLILDLVEGKIEDITGEIIYEAAVNGDAFAIRTWTEVGMYIGVACTNLIHTVNPSRIVLGGGVANAKPFLKDSIQKTIQNRGLTKEAKQTEVEFSRLGKAASSLGAIALLLVELFQPEMMN
ncbi:ROK family transcriptional regulator [Radiobacillus deserti]|uniref:ROK family transcriptional regulator n=1 Tax=Radiobacillus deserti TaxID=2594883 RepID=A0A516KK77_9BACI|nr:ROK family transcriptional regulator [Radiobacillus deserti]QDP41795.1 ROK family transcriptional regulator [Radiobacillus deserti]